MRGGRLSGSSENGPAPSGLPGPIIRAERIWKIFGRNAEKVIGTPDAELSRAELREKTGCVAAVRDVSFDVTAATREQLLQLRRHTSAMVFQHFGLLAHRTVLDNVAFGLEVQGVPKAARHARAAEVLRLVGLADAATQFPDELSGGMQQRV